MSHANRPPKSSSFHRVRHEIDFAPFLDAEVAERIEEGIRIPTRKPLLNPIEDNSRHAEYRQNDATVRGSWWEGEDFVVLTDDVWAVDILYLLTGTYLEAAARPLLEWRFEAVGEARLAFTMPDDSVHWTRYLPEKLGKIAWDVHSLKTYERSTTRFLGALMMNQEWRRGRANDDRFPGMPGCPMVVLAIDCERLVHVERGRTAVESLLGDIGARWWERYERERDDIVFDGMLSVQSWIAKGIG